MVLYTAIGGVLHIKHKMGVRSPLAAQAITKKKLVSQAIYNRKKK